MKLDGVKVVELSQFLPGPHSRAVLERAGLSAAEIDELARANVI